MWSGRMEWLLFSFMLIQYSTSSLIPINSSHLQLPSQDAALTSAEIDLGIRFQHNPWPPLPYQRYVNNGITINLTSYGDALSRTLTPSVQEALVYIQHILRGAGRPDDILEAVTNVGTVKDDVHTEVGFNSLHSPAGIKRSQALDVLNEVWQLLMEFVPAKEITSSSIILNGDDLALFRLSFDPT